MLEDVQERLVYRTHIYIQAEILGYHPADGDLAYPDKLEMMEVRKHVLSIDCQFFLNTKKTCKFKREKAVTFIKDWLMRLDN